MKKIIVTGGSGFIGSNLVKFLLNKNYFVINIDKLSYSANPYNLKETNKNKNYCFFKQDINNKNEVLKILNRFKPIGIFNLAAETHVDRSIDNPKDFIKTNILGVYNLLATVNKYLKNNKKKIKLKIEKLDDVLKKNRKLFSKKINLIKIDTEGYELEVLQGSKNAIKKLKPDYIQIEYNWHHLFKNVNLYYFSKVLKEYSAHKIMPYNQGLLKIDPQKPENNYFNYSNIVFVRNKL